MIGKLLTATWLVSSVLIVAGRPGGTGVAPNPSPGEPSARSSTVINNELRVRAAIPAPSPAGVNDERRVRAELGFRSDDAYMAQLSSTPGVDDSVGFRATPAERSEVERRIALGRLGPQLASALQSGHYAGMWVDQKGGGILTIAFTSPPDNVDLATIHREMPAGGIVRTVEATYTHNDLDIALALVTADMDAHRTPVLFYSAAVVEQRNAVIISVPRGTPASMKSIIAASYGPEVVVEEGDPYSPQQAPDIRPSRLYGGEFIASQGPRDIRSGRLYGGEFILNQKSGAECTVTYADLKSTYNETYEMTAGHCASLGDPFIQGLGGSRQIGSAHNVANVKAGGVTDCDCAAIGPTPIPGFGTNQVLVDSNAHRTFTHTELTMAGEISCHSGAKSYDIYGGVRCGTYSFVNGTCTVGPLAGGGNFTLNHCDSNTAPVLEGDSGAPVIIDNGFAGILSGGGSQGSIYSKATYVGTVGLTADYGS